MLDDAAFLERFWSKVLITDGCWLWQGVKTDLGYGKITVGSRRDGSRRQVRAHRITYELLVGPIPEGKEIDHLCRVTSCVRPDHLEAVSHRENMVRGIRTNHNVAKMHCPRGHPYDMVTASGRRWCRTCERKRWREYQQKRRAHRKAVTL